MNQAMVRIRPLRISEAAKASGLIQNWLPPEILQLTIFGCSGYYKYVEGLLATPFNGHCLLAAELDGSFAGFAEWRVAEDSYFLNMVCVTPKAQNKGVGRALFKYGVDMARAHGYPHLRLDVFDWNEHARTWYTRLGFVPESQGSWLVGNVPHPSTPSEFPIVVTGYPQAEIVHRVLGFSMFSIKTRKQTYSIGRLNHSYFRLVGLNTLSDTDLLAGLAQLGADRNILCLSDDVSQVPLGFTAITTSKRMKALTSTVEARL